VQVVHSELALEKLPKMLGRTRSQRRNQRGSISDFRFWISDLRVSLLTSAATLFQHALMLGLIFYFRVPRFTPRTGRSIADQTTMVFRLP